MLKKWSFFLFIFCSTNAFSQNTLEKQIADSLTIIANKFSYVGRINNIKITTDTNAKKLIINTSVNLSYIPFREENVQRIYQTLSKITSSKYAGYTISCTTGGQAIENLVPNMFRKSNIDTSRIFPITKNFPPLIRKISQRCEIDCGLQNRNIALWNSHGLYYNQNRMRWEWQRDSCFNIVEDLLTTQFVLNFLVPMLENAGATVFLPRERDTQSAEVIVDNDTKRSKSAYIEKRKRWKTGEYAGFADKKRPYNFGETPFEIGTYRQILSTTEEDEAKTVGWFPDIPREGQYAVYIAYKSLENSTKDAHYTVFHKGGETHFLVNQTMCGSTWVYLGTFDFESGQLNEKQGVILNNFSVEEDKIVTADAVRFGGGLGNIARIPVNSVYINDSSKILLAPETSQYPRFAEAARYYLQFAGAPDTVYSRTAGKDDYSDDFQSRGFWVNWLLEKNVPIDLALAFHTDAGTTENDSVIGTLGIFTVPNTQKIPFYKNGVSRWAGRDLSDIIQTQIVEDIRALFNPKWTRRNLWNRSYSESRVPEVPTMLLELLSHQNFADTRYTFDPYFQFVACRAIYKGILRYLAFNQQVEYIIQPLPVQNLTCEKTSENEILWHWTAATDTLEATAKAEKYIVYQAINNNIFDNGTLIENNFYKMKVQAGETYHLKVTAVNRGGESFPSEAAFEVLP